MAVEIRWTPLARSDLLKIYVDIGLEQPAAAERHFDRIVEKAGQLAVYPRMGVRRRDVRHTMRMLVEAPFIILYETIPDMDDGPVDVVEIVRVIHSRRDLPGLF